jgi:hypothetical protein
MILLSGAGTLRTILILIIVWFLLRAYLKSRQPATGARGTSWQPPDARQKGEVRIERPGSGARGPQGAVEDADFEEIK